MPERAYPSTDTYGELLKLIGPSIPFLNEKIKTTQQVTHIRNVLENVENLIGIELIGSNGHYGSNGIFFTNTDGVEYHLSYRGDLNAAILKNGKYYPVEIEEDEPDIHIFLRKYSEAFRDTQLR